MFWLDYFVLSGMKFFVHPYLDDVIIGIKLQQPKARLLFQPPGIMPCDCKCTRCEETIKQLQKHCEDLYAKIMELGSGPHRGYTIKEILEQATQQAIFAAHFYVPKDDKPKPK